MIASPRRQQFTKPRMSLSSSDLSSSVAFTKTYWSRLKSSVGPSSSYKNCSISFSFIKVTHKLVDSPQRECNKIATNIILYEPKTIQPCGTHTGESQGWRCLTYQARHGQITDLCRSVIGNRDNKTAIELFVVGVRGWEAGCNALMRRHASTLGASPPSDFR